MLLKPWIVTGTQSNPAGRTGSAVVGVHRRGGASMFPLLCVRARLCDCDSRHFSVLKHNNTSDNGAIKGYECDLQQTCDAQSNSDTGYYQIRREICKARAVQEETHTHTHTHPKKIISCPSSCFLAASFSLCTTNTLDKKKNKKNCLYSQTAVTNSLLQM